MKWKTSPNSQENLHKLYSSDNGYRTIKKFLLFPRFCDDGYTRWLQYAEVDQYLTYDYPDGYSWIECNVRGWGGN